MAGIWDTFDNFVPSSGGYVTSKQAADEARAAAQARATGASRGLTINSLYGAPEGYSDDGDPITNERFAAPGAAGGKVSRGTYGVSPEVPRRHIDQTVGQTSKGNDFYGSGNVNEVQSKLTPGQNILLGMTPTQKKQALTMLERLKGIMAGGITSTAQLPGQVEGAPVLNVPGVDPWKGVRSPGEARIQVPGVSLGSVNFRTADQLVPAGSTKFYNYGRGSDGNLVRTGKVDRNPQGLTLGEANRRSPTPTHDVSGGNNSFNPRSVQNSERWQTGY